MFLFARCRYLSILLSGPAEWFDYYAAAKATYIRLLHGKISIFFLGGEGVRPQLRTQGSDPYSAWMKYVVYPHFYIPWKFGERGSTPRGARGRVCRFLSFCLFVCPSRHDARHRKPTRCVYALNLGGTGIRPPDSSSYRSNFRFHSSFRFRSSFHSRSSSCSTTSGDIFYCSGSRQLNHSSYYFQLLFNRKIFTG